MAGALRKTMVYLGLSEEDQRHERYDGYDAYDESDRYDGARSTRAAVTQLPTAATRGCGRARPRGRLAQPDHDDPPADLQRGQEHRRVVPRQVPVIMNLSDMDDADAKRLVDFAAGLVFGLHGTIERVTSKVFLLSPAHVEISADEAETPAVATRGFFNQS